MTNEQEAAINKLANDLAHLTNARNWEAARFEGVASIVGQLAGIMFGAGSRPADDAPEATRADERPVGPGSGYEETAAIAPADEELDPGAVLGDEVDGAAAHGD